MATSTSTFSGTSSTTRMWADMLVAPRFAAKATRTLALVPLNRGVAQMLYLKFLMLLLKILETVPDLHPSCPKPSPLCTSEGGTDRFCPGLHPVRPVSSARRRDRPRGEGPRVRISFPPAESQTKSALGRRRLGE